MNIWVEKRLDVEAAALARDLRDFVGVGGLRGVRILNFYSVVGLGEDELKACLNGVFSEANLDVVWRQNPPLAAGEVEVGVALSPAQFDARADSAVKCVEMITQKSPQVRCARFYRFAFDVAADAADVAKIKKFLINPVDSVEFFAPQDDGEMDGQTAPNSNLADVQFVIASEPAASVAIQNDTKTGANSNLRCAGDENAGGAGGLTRSRSALARNDEVGANSNLNKNGGKNSCENPAENFAQTPRETPRENPAAATLPRVEILHGFTTFGEAQLREFLAARALAMSIEDLKLAQEYFAQKRRDPTITEIKVLDTYWSDHCRHTTFNTELRGLSFAAGSAAARGLARYHAARAELGSRKAVSLMDIATMGGKLLARRGVLRHLDVSDEINACSVRVGSQLLMFKNETHNHPTEIEPFGGAATCLGGAIRDPLSGRAYVFGGVRLTGAASLVAGGAGGGGTGNLRDVGGAGVGADFGAGDQLVTASSSAARQSTIKTGANSNLSGATGKNAGENSNSNADTNESAGGAGDENAGGASGLPRADVRARNDEQGANAVPNSNLSGAAGKNANLVAGTNASKNGTNANAATNPANSATNASQTPATTATATTATAPDYRDPATIARAFSAKLSQRQICTTAAAGFASYGNQIGVATPLVRELYHPGYAAKRFEMGGVLAVANADAVVRREPCAGDVVILLGGRTGADGVGGATGSSKSHDERSTTTLAAEVQKGNAPVERKIQRLFRRAAATRLVKRCNDFGAGGVSVAVGELAAGVEIDLDAVKTKRAGLDGTALALSESQERMAVAVAAADADEFVRLCGEEDLEASVIARVSERAAVVMRWRGEVIVEIEREFLDKNGAARVVDFGSANSSNSNLAGAGAQNSNFSGENGANLVGLDGAGGANAADLAQNGGENPAQSLVWNCDFGARAQFAFDGAKSFRENYLALLRDENVASQRGLVERFDFSVGANTIFAPFGGRFALTPQTAAAFRLPRFDANGLTAQSVDFSEILAAARAQNGGENGGENGAECGENSREICGADGENRGENSRENAKIIAHSGANSSLIRLREKMGVGADGENFGANLSNSNLTGAAGQNGAECGENGGENGAEYGENLREICGANSAAPRDPAAVFAAFAADPDLTAQSEFEGGYFAVVSAVAKALAAGARREFLWLSLQEYFGALGGGATPRSKARWSAVAAGLLGAFCAQADVGVGAIGGKDSMSGTFRAEGCEFDVPPTIAAFAVGVGSQNGAVSCEFKRAGSAVWLIEPLEKGADGESVECGGGADGGAGASLSNSNLAQNGENPRENPRENPANFSLADLDFAAMFGVFERLRDSGAVASAWVCERGGAAEGVAKMCFGNALGFEFAPQWSAAEIFAARAGAFVVEISADAGVGELRELLAGRAVRARLLGHTSLRRGIWLGGAAGAGCCGADFVGANCGAGAANSNLGADGADTAGADGDFAPLDELALAWQSVFEGVYATATAPLERGEIFAQNALRAHDENERAADEMLRGADLAHICAARRAQNAAEFSRRGWLNWAQNAAKNVAKNLAKTTPNSAQNPHAVAENLAQNQVQNLTKNAQNLAKNPQNSVQISQNPRGKMGGQNLQNLVQNSHAATENSSATSSNSNLAQTAAQNPAQNPAQTAAPFATKTARPKVLIPAFFGTNCEFDTQRIFAAHGADAEIFLVKNATIDALWRSAEAFGERLKTAQILFIPGGFSGADEPDGSAKFIAAFFRAGAVAAGVGALMAGGGLVGGICNGFQALIKLGLLPYGEIRPQTPAAPTLSFNDIGRHQAKIALVECVPNVSVWLNGRGAGAGAVADIVGAGGVGQNPARNSAQNLGANGANSNLDGAGADFALRNVQRVAISHGEGRFICDGGELLALLRNGQICTRYTAANPNGSAWGVEGLCSADGRVFGRMGHVERGGFKNSGFAGDLARYDFSMFKNAVEFFG